MSKIKLTEETLNRLIVESINEVIKEEGLEESVFGRIGSTLKGAAGKNKFNSKVAERDKGLDNK